MLERMRQNEFIPQETFDTFLKKKMGQGTGKRLNFVQNPLHKDNQKELLENYLHAMRNNEQEKLNKRKKKIEDERQNLSEIQKLLVLESEADRLKNADK